jgi:hypothetical protein
MKDADDAIPPEGISLLDAFEHLYRAMHPNWEGLEEGCADPGLELPWGVKSSKELNRRLADEAFLAYDRAQLETNKWLRGRIGEGSIAAFIRDPSSNNSIRLPLDGWENVGLAQSGITSNFVGPDDILEPGPDTEIRGERRPVFLLQNDFLKLVQTSFGSGAVVSSTAASAASGRGRMTRSVQRAFLELFPSREIPTTMSSLARNDAILARLREQNIDSLPNVRTIERAISALLAK